MSNKVETESELDTLKKENLELKDQISQLNREIKAMKEEMIKVRSKYYSQQPKNSPSYWFSYREFIVRKQNGKRFK